MTVERDDRPVGPAAVRVTLAGSATGALDPLVIEPAEPAEPVEAVGPVDPATPATPAILARIDGLPSLDRIVLDAAGNGVLRDGTGDAGRSVLVLAVDGAAVSPRGSTRGVERREVVIDGWRVEVDVESAARAALRERARRGRAESATSGPLEVRAIIPGVVVEVFVAAGDQVTAGQKLLVVEAMKMQNELRAPRDGAVARVAVGPKSRIEVGDVLVVLG